MNSLLDRMHWLNEPRWGREPGGLWVQTAGGTDLWQRTHYGFRRDNAHALVGPAAGEFRLHACFRFAPTAQYDQCGLVVRVDSDCWFKCSVEFENPEFSRLGSVVTNAGWSDWATQDVASHLRTMRYEVHAKDGDLVARWSADGREYRQLRVAHLTAPGPWVAGIYGCSPTGPGFRFEVSELALAGGAA